MAENEITVKLTAHEARSLRMASVFGAPSRPDPVLDSARRKLREAEHAATVGWSPRR